MIDESVVRDPDSVSRHISDGMALIPQLKMNVDKYAELRGRKWEPNEVCAVFNYGKGMEIELTYGVLMSAEAVQFLVQEFIQGVSQDLKSKARKQAEAEIKRSVDAAKHACAFCAAGTPLDLETGEHCINMTLEPTQRRRCAGLAWRRAARFISQINWG